MKKAVFILGVVAAGIVVASCGSQKHDSSSSMASPASQQAAPNSPAPVATQAPSAGASSSFTDLANYDGAQRIEDLAALGVFDSNSGAFRPNDPITRADFVRWLVKAHNAIIKDPASRIRLAQGTTATFADVPPGNADFPYIQGLTNAGYVIGVDPTHFAPAKHLTREQMIFVKAAVDEGHTIVTAGHGASELQFSDKGRIGQKYLGAVYEDSTAGTTENFQRVYGRSSLFHPQAAVTRGEAAVALSVMKGEWPVSAASVFGRTPYP